jgi:hypothetical protein
VVLIHPIPTAAEDKLVVISIIYVFTVVANDIAIVIVVVIVVVVTEERIGHSDGGWERRSAASCQLWFRASVSFTRGGIVAAIVAVVSAAIVAFPAEFGGAE